MSDSAIRVPAEQGYVRRVLFAVEIVDAVTLVPVTEGIGVSATGLSRRPVVNRSGLHVFLDEGKAQPGEIVVITRGTPYESVTVPAPVPPARRRRIELAPRSGYPFVAGVTAMRGVLIESYAGERTPIGRAAVGLQWLEPIEHGGDAADPLWRDPGLRSHSDDGGDFAAILRLRPAETPERAKDGALRVRLCVARDGTVRTSREFPLWQGRVADALPPFAWDELAP
ncbi:hypothetical protein BTHE68_72210 (plasmid) [Burkholderia sp. THE68]|uniref:hypothetical protein n=1 Tax=Burkholderia sp. THE68 TaxID=758782 RepID=UPI001315F3E9|nr:hypothetical protein [Burkholderia sp. THE68]BBU33487.1 hypothetical protein BTHE68_72210 [Burkholderia sp. THE68]